jgi:hypothetical protein
MQDSMAGQIRIMKSTAIIPIQAFSGLTLKRDHSGRVLFDFSVYACRESTKLYNLCTAMVEEHIDYLSAQPRGTWPICCILLSSCPLGIPQAYIPRKSQKSSVNSTVLHLYQRMTEEAKSNIEEEVDRPTVAGHQLQVIHNAAAQERKSIQLCLSLCNRALEFTKSGDFQVEEGRSVISSIAEFLPEELSYDGRMQELFKNSHSL